MHMRCVSQSLMWGTGIMNMTNTRQVLLLIIPITLEGSEIAWRHDFDIYDLQNKKEAAKHLFEFFMEVTK